MELWNSGLEPSEAVLRSSNLFNYKCISWIASVGPLSTSLTGIGSSLGMPAISSDPFGTRKMSTPGLNPPTFQQSKMKACKWWCGWESAGTSSCISSQNWHFRALQKSFWHISESYLCVTFISGPKMSLEPKRKYRSSYITARCSWQPAVCVNILFSSIRHIKENKLFAWNFDLVFFWICTLESVFLQNKFFFFFFFFFFLKVL